MSPSRTVTSTCRRRRTGRFVFALGLPILGYGFVFKNWWILAVGVVWLMFGMTGWATEPSTEPGS